MKNRILALFLAAALLISALPGMPALAAAGPRQDAPLADDSPFTDIPRDAYFFDAVIWAVNHQPQITAGTGATSFSPNAACTRAQVVTFLWRAAGKPAPKQHDNPFSDVASGAYYYDAVLWAVEQEITAGVSKDRFAPGNTCTRAQIATFLWRFEGKPKAQAGQQNPFTDVAPGAYYYDAVLWAVEQGITAGTSKTAFSPNKTCTRAQVVTFLYRDDAKEDQPDQPYAGYVSKLDGSGSYVRGDDTEVYNANLSGFDALIRSADAAASMDERYVLEARAEAALLDTAAVIPTSSQGGAYTISRVAPHTSAFVQWGSDDVRWHSLVISDEFISREERAALLDQWSRAMAGEGSYDPAAYLTGKGHSLQKEYVSSFSAPPVTLDWLSSSAQSDTEIVVQTVDGLVEYDNLGNLQPKLAESWEVSEDGLTYTFHLRRGVKWYTSDGAEYAEVTAGDFVAAMHHLLDAGAGLEYLCGGSGANIAGVDAYLSGDGSFDDVGIEAVDDYTLRYTTTKPVPCFMTMLSYSIFLPMCKAFYEANGGVYGIEALRAQRESGAYKFGLPGDPSSQVYCGPFLLKKLEESEILCVKNPNYYDADRVTLDAIRWRNLYEESVEALYDNTVSGVYAGISLSEASGTLGKAKAAGIFDQFAYVSDTSATTYFGALNLNRGTFVLENGACASPKSEQAKADAVTALNNKLFRKALQHAFDKKAQNAVTRGEELAETNLRNMINHPKLVKLGKSFTDADGHTFPAGTLYGEIVQYYCDQLGCKVDCRDGVDGWYKPDAAREYLAAAKQELGDLVSWPIQIDIVHYASDLQLAQAQAYKTSIENTLGAENVVVNLIRADDAMDYYACGYRAQTGMEINYDMSWGSGWAPDFGDPSTCLSIFRGAGLGYMTRTLGLY